MTQPALSHNLDSVPPQTAVVPLGIAASVAAIWTLISAIVLLRGAEWNSLDKIPQVATIYALIVGIVGIAWVSAGIRTATMLGALAGIFAMSPQRSRRALALAEELRARRKDDSHLA